MNSTADDKMTALLQQIEHGTDMGIYPAAVKCYNDERDYEQRDGFKNGWNACVIEYGRAIDAAVERAKEGVSEDLQMLLAADVGSLHNGVLELNMNDTWMWACSDGEEVPEEEIPEVARLFKWYGHCGLLYWVSRKRGGLRSEFHDNNRFIDFVAHEEALREKEPSSSKRAYMKIRYTLGRK